MSENLTGYPSIDKPWLKYYSEEAINAELPKCTIYEYLWKNNKEYPNDIAIEYMGRKISYEELFEHIDECVRALTVLEVKPGDIVTVALPSIPEVLYIVYALNKMGAVANMIHPLAGEKEIINYINEVNSEVAVIYEGTYRLIKDVISASTVKHVVVVSAEDSLPISIKWLYFAKNKMPKISERNVFVNWRHFIELGTGAKVTPVIKDSSTVAIISHTGGTTGEPKGVMCSDKNINALIWQIGCNLPHRRQERYMSVLPPFINYSLVNSMLEGLAFGFRVILIPKYEKDKFDEYIKKYQPNHISSIPDYWEAILSNEKLKTMDLSCLRYVFYGGEAMEDKKEKEVNRLLRSCGAHTNLRKGLGSTEMVSASTVTYDDCNMPGSVGVPLVKINCKIVEPGTCNELTYNKIGEVCFSGDTMMLGYYNESKATADIIKVHPDGDQWLHTGDLGYKTENGILFVSGRIKRILMTKGNDGIITKLFPVRIEKAVMLHPSVNLCCVIGIPDERRVHYPKAYLVLNEGYEMTGQLKEEILKQCQEVLPDYMIPLEIAVRESLPRTERGKIDYRVLEKESVRG